MKPQKTKDVLSNADPLGFPVEPANTSPLQHLSSNPDKIIIIDTPAGNGDITTYPDLPNLNDDKH